MANLIPFSLLAKQEKELTTPTFLSLTKSVNTWRNLRPMVEFYLQIFSSNKMQPHILIECLASHFGLSDQILLLLLNFLKSSAGFSQWSNVRHHDLQHHDRHRAVSFLLCFLSCTQTPADPDRKAVSSLSSQMILSCCHFFRDRDSGQGSVLSDLCNMVRH